MTAEEPRLMQGGVSVDERGAMKFVNDFDFAGVRRFYIVEPRQAGVVRAWHAHRRERKYVTVVRGEALVGAVRIEDWSAPPRDSQVHRYVLAARGPAVLSIPGGYANGFQALTADTVVVFFSTATLEESQADDVRLAPDYFGNVWAVVETGRG